MKRSCLQITSKSNRL